MDKNAVFRYTLIPDKRQYPLISESKTSDGLIAGRCMQVNVSLSIGFGPAGTYTDDLYQQALIMKDEAFPSSPLSVHFTMVVEPQEVSFEISY